VIETSNTSMVFTGTQGGKFMVQYYGTKLSGPEDIMKSGTGYNEEAYTTFGLECTQDKALRVTHADGNMSVDLYLKDVSYSRIDENIQLMKVSLYDNQYPFQVELYYQSFYEEDVIQTWSVISHKEKKPVTLYKYASFYLPVRSFEPWVTHFHGNWADDFRMTEEPLTRGLKEIRNREGIRNARHDNPSFMLSLNGRATETSGEVIGGALSWTGNYKLSFNYELKNVLNVFAGINEDASHYILEPKEQFETPKFVFTFSGAGKGDVSRNMHRWARNYQLIDGKEDRMVLLNSWEGVYFDIKEEEMLSMIDDIADMGGELFVMDDGWFGDKYPRDNARQGLGDWMIDRRKLPNGLTPLIEKAEQRGIGFGIWLEPEMLTDPSEIFDKHPDWVVQQKNREIVKGRGGAQMLLDLSNPEVQDHVFHIIHDLLVEYPKIQYIKWDANHFISNVGSTYLPKNKQSHLYIEYHRGLIKVLERIRAAHPDIIMQACASGGGRVNYAFMPYFHEFWTSDLTDALTRVYIQWGASFFYPSIALGSHVSAAKNHQSGRVLPLKFRCDVAMAGRFGLELQPSELEPDEVEFTKSVIENYKSIRPVVQHGDQYRLISPYENYGLTSMMYVNEDKSRAVIFVYNLENNFNTKYPPVKLSGLDPERKYRLKELNAIENDRPKFGADNSILTGDALMNAGIQANLRSPYQSRVIELIAE
jgi:alpha-galactosidase